MEEGFGEEMPPLGAFDGDHIQSKERESSLASNGRFLVGSQEIISLTGSVCLDSSSHHVLPGILECKNQNISLISVDSLEQSWDNPRSNDDMSGMVEELTVRNYDNLNLTMVGISKSSNKVHGRRNQCQGSSVLDRKSDVSEKVKSYENKRIQGDEALELNNSIRRKMLSESGFSQYFMKNTLKAKGLTRQGQPVERYHCESKDQVGSRAASDALIDLAFKSVLPSVHKKSATKANTTGGDGVNLREWLNNGHREVNKVERLNIFKQIVLLVDYSHSQGVSLLELRPSCFSLLASNKVKYLGSSEGREYPGFKPKGISNYGWIAMKRPAEPGQLSSFVGAKQKKVNHQQLSCFPSITGLKVETASFSGKNASNLWYSGQFGEQNQCSEFGSSSSSIQCLPTTVEAEQKRIILNKLLEENWYQSSEKQNDGVSKVSNIYSLGVFLFELSNLLLMIHTSISLKFPVNGHSYEIYFTNGTVNNVIGLSTKIVTVNISSFLLHDVTFTLLLLMHFDSERARTSAMMDLHLRILPPNFLLENLEEAGFCLLLLHPDPVSRPSSRQILESNVLNELKGVNDVSTEELTSCIEQEDIGSELLVHFLATLEKHKKKDAFKLVQDIKCLESDIEEIRRRNYMARVSERSCMHLGKSEVESPWVGKMGTLETAYFSMRTRINPPEMDASSRMDSDLLRTHNNSNDELHNSLDPLGSFFDGLSKYAQYSNFKVHGVIRNSKLNNSSNVVCSLSFDRNEDYFAAAGMSKKIKIFDFNSLLNESVDIHYPVIEMSNRSKLSCISWNGYIHNYVASTDYDGIVKLWDASTGQAFMQYMEHGKQAWSVDFCPSYPTKLASGSDDCCVKLWSINERNSLGTIKNAATVCSVQFCTHSTNLLAFGSADYRTYLYDLRNVRRPWCVLGGHEKAISYVKFLDSGTVVTASTDNSLKLWDLQKTSSCSLSTNACCLTFRGHTNEKNFVGLSVADGYITCGSETNEVYVYHKSMQMPIMSHKLGSIEPISGKETNEENGQFVSSVCWRGNSNMLVAASSSGCIKALQLV